jgi:glutaredoxin
MFFARPTRALGLMGLLAVAGFSGNDANAQQIFRIVGADGRVTFSDKPPLDANGKPTAAPAVSLSGGGAQTASLPIELRNAVNRYPVTLYTAPGCVPCGSARAMLSGRGVPFTEKTVSSNEDIEALKRIAGGASVPFLTIGGQQLKGYSETEWAQFLDAADYPKTSQLPASYVQPPATPLVAVQQPQAPVRAAAAPSPARAAAPAPAPAAENPAGIRF